MKQLLKLFIIGLIVVLTGKVLIGVLPAVLTMVQESLILILKAAWYIFIGYVALRIYDEWKGQKRERYH